MTKAKENIDQTYPAGTTQSGERISDLTPPQNGIQNEKVNIFLDILTGVTTVLGNNVLQNKGMGRIVTLLQYAAGIVRDVSQGAGELEAVNKIVQAMVDGHRGPSDEEWAVWDERLGAVDQRFAAVKAQLI